MTSHLNDLQEIRKMMEKSSRFLSLSGLSGVSAGVVALVAAALAYFKREELMGSLVGKGFTYAGKVVPAYVDFLIKLAVITLVLAIASGIFFTWRKAKKSIGSLWNPVSKKLVLNMAIPLLAGGAVILALLANHVYFLIPELTLIFYGLALISASQYTYRDVFYLGLCELILGVLGLGINGYSLLLWTMGFGLLHILYGIIMHQKYDRK
ncbi:hypothetical protein [Jiulongibacter sediminis]|jgi:predicted lysophospholipase L1 biosynthesis ABC-type transport system permease subunit|uniref:hypothetical protein n=1 Tax=Jiulongibacter sediminis TaxID=1605367 RepID=UPI0026EBD0CB|nr:hypothetical protein [Jiulongibacter sediminis]